MDKIPVNIWRRNQYMELDRIVRFQILLYCYMENKPVPYGGRLDCLTLLGLSGTTDLLGFCETLVKLEIFASITSARNAIGELEGQGLIQKNKMVKGRKTVNLNPDIKLHNSGTILVDIKCMYRSESETLA